MPKKVDAREVIARLEKEYPRAKIALHYANPLQLLVATILSAQSTDEIINRVTPALFAKYHSAKDYARADINQLEQDIRSTGFFRNKAKNIQAAARMIVDDFGGKLPPTMEQMTKLPGVGRKTANIVLYNAFGITAGIAVDTHVKRLSGRIGLSDNQDPDKIEQDLMRQVPKGKWGDFSYLLIEHGRAMCQAKKPKCGECVLNDICRWEFKSKYMNVA
jgi:endonuclease-3